MSRNKYLQEFYENKFDKYGDSPLSLSHNDQTTQYLRFEKTAKVFDEDKDRFSVHDFGCGLGHFYRYLKEKGYNVEYSGSDISPKFIEFCEKEYPECNFMLRDFMKETGKEIYDYVVQSGMFNVRLEEDDEAWKQMCRKWITKMFDVAAKGISFNFITSWSEYRQPGLYYESPENLMTFIQKNLSRFVQIYHAYPLYEFSVAIYKEKYIKSLYPQKAYSKYFKV